MGTNANSDTPIIALAAEYNFMKDNTSEKVIAQTVLAHISEIPHMTLEEAAACCNVSVSTFLRFCRSIGYSSYGAFKMKMSEAITNYNYRNAPFSQHILYNSDTYFDAAAATITDAITHLKEVLDISSCKRLAEKIYEKKKIYLHDAMYSSVRLSLQSDLAVTGKIVTFSPNNVQQSKDARLADKDSLYLLNYDGSQRSSEVPKTLRAAREKEAFTAVISHTRIFPGSEYCDILLEIGKGNSLISDFMLHDMVYQYLSVIYREKYF